jgi:uncharacterized protein with PQ loop repeat
MRSVKRDVFTTRRKVLHKTVSIMSIIYPLTALPQLIEIYIHKNVEGVSLASWVLFLLFMIPLFLYAKDQQDRKLSVMYGIWLVIYIIIIGGVLMHQ